MRCREIVAVVAFGVCISGCGTTKGDRGLLGAGIGTGVGALGPPGVAVGMATELDKVNLGEPVWD